jgi:hypothetical protein
LRWGGALPATGGFRLLLLSFLLFFFTAIPVLSPEGCVSRARRHCPRSDPRRQGCLVLSAVNGWCLADTRIGAQTIDITRLTTVSPSLIKAGLLINYHQKSEY